MPTWLAYALVVLVAGPVFGLAGFVALIMLAGWLGGDCRETGPPP